MEMTISCSQAKRRLHRLMDLVAEGQVFVITKHGNPLCRLEQHSIKRLKGMILKQAKPVPIESMNPYQ